MKIREVKIHTTHQAFSAISHILESLDITSISKEVFKDNAEEVLIKAYCDPNFDLEEKLKLLKNKIFKLKEYGIDIGSGRIIVEDLEEDWVNKWKEDFHSFRVGDNIVIKPSWEELDSQEGEIVIEIDPGQAFGTGYHQTTNACLEMVESYLKPRFNFLDIGTGTGILSIAAAKLGAESLLALDIDPTAIKVAKENATLNKVEDRIDFSTGDLLEVVKGRYELVVANIIPMVILRLIPDLPKVLTEDGYFILSGILEDRLRDIKEELSRNDLEIVEIIQKGEWVTLVGSRRG